MSTLAAAPLLDLLQHGASSPDEVAAKLVPAIWNHVQFRSAATPDLDAEVAYDPNGPPSPALQWLRPTVILTGAAGRTVIAPYGLAPDSGALVAVGAFVGIIGIGFVLGRLSK